MVNTGWSGGPYGVGKRMKLGYTRAMITAALEGRTGPGIRLMMPVGCPGVPS
jgi:phosphoenolpyruvate carboxykinase (ATP)